MMTLLLEAGGAPTVSNIPPRRGGPTAKHSVLIDYFFFLVFCLFRAIPIAYGSSHLRGHIGATVSGLCHSHSNVAPEPRLRPTPWLTAPLDP